MIRCSIQIANNRLTDNEFTNVFILQEVGTHNSFEVRLRQDAQPGVLLEKTKDWIGEPITIGVEEKEDDQIQVGLAKEFFKGIVTSVSLSRRSGIAELVVRGNGPSISMDDGPHTRSFTEKGLQEIADEVLGPYGSFFSDAPVVSPENFTDIIDYCVQYKESNFSFLDRLSDRYGEWFYYDGVQFYFGKPDGEDPIKLNFGEDGLTHFDMSVRALPGKFEIKAYDYVKHQFLSEEAPESTELNDLGREAMKAANSKIYTEKPLVAIQSFTEKNELENIAKRREQITMDEVVFITGGSSNSKLKLGCSIEIEDQLIKDSYGTYVITKISHHIDQGGDYNNSFEAIPTEIKTPPLSKAPVPPYCEMQLAKVVDVNDDEALGRIKVEFLWQEGTGETSPWLRVASPYTGKDKGFYIIPEVDDQVLVAFENNNPNKPYVLTGMYNGDAKPEWFDPKNHSKGFKSKGKNEWKFDDKSKSITINAPDTINMTAGKTINVKTGGKSDSSINIDVGDGTVNIIAKKIIVKAAETFHVDSKKEALIDATTTINLDSKKEVIISGAVSVSVSSVDVKIDGTKSSKVSGGMVDVSAQGPLNAKGAIIKLN
mgnify:CR=1 FL=1